jgi:hypothetical protein
MNTIARRVNRVLSQTVGVQVIPGAARRVALSDAWFTRMLHLNRLLETVVPVPGDIVECGVASGTSLALMASLAKAQGQTRRIWGFDCWEGLPAPEDHDLGDSSVAARGIFAEASPQKVIDELVAYGLGEDEISDRVTLVPGLFSETLPSYRAEIALLHLDVDLYQSYSECLTRLWPMVSPGGVVAFDEYEDTESWPGAKRAIDEFLVGLGTCQAERLSRDESSGKYFVVKV